MNKIEVPGYNGPDRRRKFWARLRSEPLAAMALFAVMALFIYAIAQTNINAGRQGKIAADQARLATEQSRQNEELAKVIKTFVEEHAEGTAQSHRALADALDCAIGLFAIGADGVQRIPTKEAVDACYHPTSPQPTPRPDPNPPDRKRQQR